MTARTTFDFTDRELDRHQAKVAHLTGICPKCGDAGYWIEGGDFHVNYCDCPFGVAERAKAAAEDAAAQAEAEREQELKERQSSRRRDKPVRPAIRRELRRE